MPTRSFTLLLIAGLLSAAIGQAPPTSQASPAREQRRQTYLELSKKIFAGAQAPDAVRRAVNNLPPAQVTGITEQLHDLSVAEIEDVLGGPKPSAQNVIDALKTILGETALAGWGAQFTNTPFAEFIETRRRPSGGSFVWHPAGRRRPPQQPPISRILCAPKREVETPGVSRSRLRRPHILCFAGGRRSAGSGLVSGVGKDVWRYRRRPECAPLRIRWKRGADDVAERRPDLGRRDSVARLGDARVR